MPLVSVIIPVYKTEAYLPRCFESLLSQTLKDLEVILVDDGSPDNSGKICDEYAEKHSIFRVIHKENGGAQLARVAGIQAATGKYLAFLDSDDFIMPDMFSSMVEAAEIHGADLVAVGFTRDYGSYQEPYENLIPSGVYRDEQLSWLRENAVFSIEAMTQSFAPCVWNKLFLRESMQDILLHCKDKLSFGEDALHTFAALFSSKCVVVINEQQCYRYQLREGSTTNSYYKNYLSDLFIVYDRLMELAKPVYTEKLIQTIAYDYVFLYLGGIAQELGKANPANLQERYRKIRAIAADRRLSHCIAYIDLAKYPRHIAAELKLLAAGRHNSFLVFHILFKFRSKFQNLRKKVFR